jgi:hypothetical protein
MLLMSALMGLVFLSSGTGHDEAKTSGSAARVRRRSQGLNGCRFSRFADAGGILPPADAADQVLLDDPFEHFGARVIPDPVRPDDRDRPGRADLQAIGLGPL